jgi:hypothetical protein
MEGRQISSEFIKLGSEALYLRFEIHNPIYELSFFPLSAHKQSAERENEKFVGQEVYPG